MSTYISFFQIIVLSRWQVNALAHVFAIPAAYIVLVFLRLAYIIKYV